MGYFTVIARSKRTAVPTSGVLVDRDQERIFKGVKAKTKFAAVDIVAAKLGTRVWTYDVYMSKRRPRRYKHSKHTNKLRRPWAVLAKNAKRQHFNVLNRWSNLHYHRMTYMAWEDDTPPVFPVMKSLEELFPDLRSVTDLAQELEMATRFGATVLEDKDRIEAIVHNHYESQVPENNG